MAQKGNIIEVKQWFTNADDDARVYDITAAVRYNGNQQMADANNGTVMRNSKEVARFSHNGVAPSYSFSANISAKEQSEVVLAICAFITEVATLIATE